MNCPGAEDWGLLAVGAFEDDRAASMLSHAGICQSCREAFDVARRDHVRLVRMYEALDRDHDDLREQLMAALPDALPGHCGPGQAVHGRRRLGDYLMTLNTKTNRRAAAILLPAACLVIVVAIFLSPGQKSAFATAIEHLRRAKTIVCHVNTTVNFQMQPQTVARTTEGEPSKRQEAYQTSTTWDEKLYMSAEDGTRRDTVKDGTVMSTTYTPQEGPVVVLNRVDHTYQTLPTDAEEMPQEFRNAAAKYPTPEIHFASLPNDPDRLIHGLRDLTDEADEELGRDRIDGHEVVGYTIAGRKVGFGPPWTDQSKKNRAELWVDLKTGVPVRLVFHYAKQIKATREIPRVTSYALTIVYDQFEWDTALPADWFTPEIPGDYAQLGEEAQQPMAAPDEVALLAALLQFGELAGRYPASLNVSDVSYEIAVLAGMARARQLVAKRAGKAEPPSPDLKPMSGLTYFALLDMQGRKPEYFGKDVKPGQADLVLMRWQLRDGGARLIYGDLRTETIASSQR